MKKVRIVIFALFICLLMVVACSCSSSSANDLPVTEGDSVGDILNNESVQEEPNKDEQTKNESIKKSELWDKYFIQM